MLEPLKGSVYIANPFDNPFGSLLAVYLVVEDRKDRRRRQARRQGRADPSTGQLTTTFDENPQLPLEDVITAHIFGGPRGALVTPPRLRRPTPRTAQLTPWSAPEGPTASPQSSFQTTTAPGGGPARAREAQLPNAPSSAPAPTPPRPAPTARFVFKLSREDGTQRFAGIEATLPTGLLAKLAGVADCSEAQIAGALARRTRRRARSSRPTPAARPPRRSAPSTPAPAPAPTPTTPRATPTSPAPTRAPRSAWRHRPGGGRPLRPRHRGRPQRALRRPRNRPDHRRLRPAAHDPRRASRSTCARSRCELDRPELHPQPDLLRPEMPSPATPTSTLGQARRASPALPGRRLRIPPLQAQARRSSSRARPTAATTRRLTRRLHRQAGRSQHRRRLGRPAPLGVPRPGPHPHDLHPRAVRRRPVPGGLGLRPRQGDHARCSTTRWKARSTCAPPPTSCPTWSSALRGPAYQPIDVDAAGRIDSVNGGLRNTFEAVPDAPVTKVILTLQGGKKGLFQNSTNICKGTHRATLCSTPKTARSTTRCRR